MSLPRWSWFDRSSWFSTDSGRCHVEQGLRSLDPKTKQPVSNGARNVWATETALTTALNTSYMASQLALFAIVVGIALLLSGIGFGVLAAAGALRSERGVLSRPAPAVKPTPATI